jgi:hypothetical protein
MSRQTASASVSKEQFSDPIWRISNLYFIVDKNGREVKFEPNQQQLDYLLNLHGRDIILKARQLGFTTLASIISLDECVWTPNWAAAIIAHTKPDAQKILKTKVAFPYSKLPDGIKQRVYPVNDAADTFALSNNSSVVVTNSARGGTLQRLHVSEFGKICARFPDKAQEIISGSFPAAENGSITVESTAEGQQGAFFDMTQRALEKQRSGQQLSKKDFKLHFYPWYENPDYQFDARHAVITDENRRYFDKLERDIGITLTPDQRCWWVMQEEVQGGTMKREYPATPEEAFEQALEGAYFEKQFEHAYKAQNIGRFPYDPNYPVNTFWDLGRNDINAIWLHQRMGSRNRFVGYYENSGEFIEHYIRWLSEWAKERSASWGDHYWPHDGDRQDLFLEHGRVAVVQERGFKPIIVPRVAHKLDAIEAARKVFATCDWDEEFCAPGIKRLKHYRKEWDDRRGVWKDRPNHDENSNGADAFLTFATGYVAQDGDWSKPIRRSLKGVA